MIKRYDFTFWCDCPLVPACIIIEKHKTHTIDIVKYIKKVEIMYVV